ncbi:MAG TPA: integration host factor, actinobacterial type [Solirubrobacterales bacterium]
MRSSKAGSRASAPERSLDQRVDALKRANDIRTARSKLKKDLGQGRASIETLLLDPPDYVMTAKVFDMLLASPKCGRVKTNRLMNQARISPSKTIGGLSVRQRIELVALLGGRKPGRKAADETASPTQGERVAAKRAPRDPAEFLLAEWERLIGDRRLGRTSLERAARIAAAEESWRSGLGALLSGDDVLRLLEVSGRQLGNLRKRGQLIVLTNPGDADRYPAYQFQDGKPSPPLVRAHRMLVESGHVSSWTAASWARTSHPELEELSPAQWSGEKRSEETLLRVAEHDASRLAQ